MPKREEGHASHEKKVEFAIADGFLADDLYPLTTTVARSKTVRNTNKNHIGMTPLHWTLGDVVHRARSWSLQLVRHAKLQEQLW